jgi:hypothetical protein
MTNWLMIVVQLYALSWDGQVTPSRGYSILANYASETECRRKIPSVPPPQHRVVCVEWPSK